jgi:beta-lactam-binding protein with PASTA domain
MTVAQARTRIVRAHCSVAKLKKARSKKVGRVIKQSPKPGTVARRGFPVKLTVGRR